MERLLLTSRHSFPVNWVLTCFYFLTGFSFTASAQHTEDCLTGECTDHSLVACFTEVQSTFESLSSTTSFQTEFQQHYRASFTEFSELNGFYMATFGHTIARKVCQENYPQDQLDVLFFSLVDQYSSSLLFAPLSNPRSDVTYLGKDMFVPHGDEQDMWFGLKSRADACLNTNFEESDFSSWQTFCGNVDNTIGNIINLAAYTPPLGCPAPIFGGPQHSIVTGGVDPNTGFPCVFPDGGGASAMIGDGTGSNSRASVVRKTFTVDATNTILTYSYMAVLEDPGGHVPGEKPFFRTRLYDQNGISDPCAEYFAYGGDGQPGWIVAGGLQYRDWTTIFIPLDAYIGQDVTIEFATGDCSLSGHYGYAYVDASCSALEIEQVCEGTSTVLIAPDGGASYLWSTGETTQQITVNTPGVYTCEVTPVGSTCSVLLDIDVILFPVPTADFTFNSNIICEDGEVLITDQSTIDPGGVIASWEWNFGDGISTPASSGTITGVPQTIGTYTAPEHTYNLTGTPDIELEIVTADGCVDTYTLPLTITTPPTAVIGADAVVCEGDLSPLVTFTGAGTAGPYTFTFTINGGPDQQVSTSGGLSSVDVLVATGTPGTYVYELTHVSDPASSTCAQDQNGTATIVVNPLPVAQIAGDATVCENDGQPVVTFTGANAQGDYEFTYTINGGAPQVIATAGSSSVGLNVPTGTAGTYTYELLNVVDLTTGCQQAQNGTATVVVNPLPTAVIGSDAQVCQDANAPQVTFSGAGGTGDYTFFYTLNGGAMLSIAGVGGVDAVLNAPTSVPGTFVYELTGVEDSGTGCSQVQNGLATITVNPLPVATISSPVEACFGDLVQPQVTFTGSDGTAPYTFTYSINNGPDQLAVSNGGGTITFGHSTNQVGTFTYTISHIVEGSLLACEQDQLVSTTVTIHDLPNVEAGNAVTVCAGDNILLTGSGAQSYAWDHGITNGVPFTWMDTTLFTVTGTDINGCQNTDQVWVNVVPIPVMDIDGMNLVGCAPITPTFINNSTGNLTNCTWLFGDGTVLNGCGSVSTTFEVPGCYDVTLMVSTPEGCANSMTIPDFACALETPVADFYPSPAALSTYDWESQMINESSGATHFEWNFGDGSPVSTAHSPTHAFPNDEGDTYQVMLVAWNGDGCVDTAYAQVNLSDELLVYVPNTFTPDDDRHNDAFRPVFEAGYDPYNYSMWIYNRWGEIVFETHDVEIGWGGRYGVDGITCQDGTYTWKIEVKRRNSPEIVQLIGHVNLLR